MSPSSVDPAGPLDQGDNYTNRNQQIQISDTTKVEHDENVPNLCRTISKHEQASNTNISNTDGSSILQVPDPPPDGGVYAWTQVLMGHIVIFNTWGLVNSFGVFQVYYISHLNRPKSDISWVGSVQIFLLFSIGTFSGRACDAGYFKQCFIVGLGFQLVGVFMTSLSTTYWQLFLAQGLCTGISNGLLFCPTLAVLTTYFQKRRGIALGLAACGTATGGVIFPVLAQHLLPKLGFPWTIRVIGFIMLGTMMLPLFFMHSRLPPRPTGPLVDFAAFKELPYTLFAIGNSVCFLGLYFTIYYISAYAVDEFGITTESSFTLLIILNACGVAGRLIPNLVSDLWLGPLNTMIPMILISSLLVYLWIIITPAHSSLTGYQGFAGIYGFVSSGALSVFPLVSASLVPPDKAQMIGVRLGMIMTCICIPVMIGPPIGGALIQACSGGYLGAQLFFGTVLLFAMGFLLALRFARVGTKVLVKI